MTCIMIGFSETGKEEAFNGSIGKEKKLVIEKIKNVFCNIFFLQKTQS